VIKEGNKIKSTTYKMVDWWKKFIGDGETVKLIYIDGEGIGIK
jgi:hypothetical protein